MSQSVTPILFPVGSIGPDTPKHIGPGMEMEVGSQWEVSSVDLVYVAKQRVCVVREMVKTKFEGVVGIQADKKNGR